jgi:hypothetical protein
MDDVSFFLNINNLFVQIFETSVCFRIPSILYLLGRDFNFFFIAIKNDEFKKYI